MQYNTLFEMIQGLAEQKAYGQEVKSVHYLYGIAQVIEMKPEALKIMVSDNGLKELEKLCEVVEKENIDKKIFKQGISLLVLDRSKGCSVQHVLDKIKKDSGEVPVDSFFAELVKCEREVCGLFTKGSTMETVIVAIKSQSSSAESKEERKKTADSKSETVKEVKTEIQAESAIPAELADWEKWNDLATKGRKLYNQLREQIFGQDDAIRKFVQGYFQSEVFAGVDKKESPNGIFLLAGPPGVGKTFLATTAAKILDVPVMRFNMSEYSDHQSTLELIGTSKKFSGAKAGALTTFVKENPKSVIIFDEVEKAHLNVIHLFLQILDAGMLKDSYYETNISFKNTLIIFTTNVGKKLYEENREENLSMLSQSVVLDALANERHPLTGHEMFPAAICSRFATGNVIMFNHLKSHHLSQIASRKFDKCAEMFEEKYGITIEFDSQLSTLFLFHMSNGMDARIISSQSNVFVENELYELARQTVGQADFSKLEKIRFLISLPTDDPDVLKLFMQEKAGNVAIMADEHILSQVCDEDKKYLHIVKDWSELERIVVEKDVQFVIIDPLFGYHSGKEKGYFSLEDYDTEGIRCFEMLSEKIPSMPVYIVEQAEQMRETDKNTFLQMGARGIISCMEGTDLGSSIKDILQKAYLQRKVEELSRQEKVLNYNTAQMISKDETEAAIIFHGFKLTTAIKADNKAMVMTEAKKPNVRFEDIIGAKNACEELKYFVKYLKNPKEFMIKGSKPPKGVLLYGPPGTGKTMLAKAMAGEAGVTFLPTTATEFMKKYVGEGEERVRNLFSTAKKYAPSVIFIDEIDAIGKERTGNSSTQHTETLLNALLTEMDGFSFDPAKPVFVLAATNFPLDRSKARGGAIIDPALLRRFDNKILVDLPDQEERKEFLIKRTKKIDNCQLSEQVLDNVAERTTGESLAILQNIIELAVRNAMKAGRNLNDKFLLDAMEEYNYGEEHVWGREYYESVAHHEAGHAYISYLAGVKPSFITIVSRGDFGGYMQSASGEKTPCYTKSQLIWRIRTALAGRASEIVFYGEEEGINTGVSGDLETATNLALNMLCRYGMSGKSLISLSPDRVLNSALGEKFLEEAQEILEEELENTIKLVQDGRDKVNALANALLEKNQLVAGEIEEILG